MKRWFLVTCPLLLRSSRLGASWGRSCTSQSQPPSVPPLEQADGSTYSRLLVEPKAQRCSRCFQAVTTPLTFYSLLQHCQPVGDLRLQLVDAECSVKWSQMIEDDWLKMWIKGWDFEIQWKKLSAPSETWKVSPGCKLPDNTLWLCHSFILVWKAP